MEHIVKIISVKDETHDVKMFRCEKPMDYNFTPGQATEVAINKEGWQKEKRPFTFTSLNEASELEFVIKIYKDHSGVTNEMNGLVPGDELIIDDVWGAIEYKGPGYFITGGAGITPFIAILRQLSKENRLTGNKLFFSNKTEGDIILKDELISMLNGNAFFTITDEQTNSFHNGFINEQFLKDYVQDFSKKFYLCGPPKMVEVMQKLLEKSGASSDSVVFEK